jgi:signal transduction histidine kinase
VRRRIAALTVLAAVLATALFGIPLAVAAARYFIADEHQELEHTADTVALAVSGDLARAQPPAALTHPERGTEVGVYNSGGMLVRGVGPGAPGPLLMRASRGAVASGQINGRYAVAVPVSDGDAITGAVLVTADPAQVYRRIAAAWAAMAGLGTAAVAVSWLLARRQSRRLTEPLERMSLSAERLGAGDFTVRSDACGIAEIDSVNVSLERTAGRLAALIERERAFTADASHQLRTPLTGMQLSLEAALDDPQRDPRPAMREALAAADRLQATVTDLLALARDTPRPLAPLDLDDLMAGLHARWNGALAASGRPLRIATHAHAPGSDFSQACAEQILDVLVDNAHQHGLGTVTVTARDAGGALAIDVSDEGGPISRDARALFVRRSAGARGTGIGLALARSLAESEGGRLNLSSRSPTTFTLIAPPRPDTLDPHE